MNLIGSGVTHKTFGKGKITAHDGTHITISFTDKERKFTYPDGFINHLNMNNKKNFIHISGDIEKKRVADLFIKNERDIEKSESLEKMLSHRISRRGGKKKSYLRPNVAFKCNYCDGGRSDKYIGYSGVCSDQAIQNNILKEKRTSCSESTSPCRQYIDGEITRSELEHLYGKEKWVCYESQILKNWKALAGVFQRGVKKGTPMKLQKVQANNLCILTTREPHMKEAERFIFAVFLVDETYEGGKQKEGYVTANAEYRITLSPEEARTLLFWTYYTNTNRPDTLAWSSGLHRFYEDTQAVQILKEIAILKKGTADEELANRFLNHFCKLNKINIKLIPEPSGALTR